MFDIKSKVMERFLRYVKFDTESDPQSATYPSTEKQFELANALVEELKEIGLTDAAVDKYCYVTATLPANTDTTTKTIGFLAHMDTSPDMPGKDVKPTIVENYDGGDILLNREKKITLSPTDFPSLENYKGDTIIATDGTTLLGADNKAGIAEIVTAMEYLLAHPKIKHGTIKIAFTPDEEIGRGVDFFDVEKFNADFAYTLDGGPLGELEYENFNAAAAKVTINGTSIHPGGAKNRMINSMQIAMELNSLLPAAEKPEYTEHYEGFIHLVTLQGNVEKTGMNYIIRDHDKDLFAKKKETMQNAVNFLNQKYGPDIVRLELQDSYYNMKEKIEPVIEIIHLATAAMEEVGIEPKISPIRGGTDGARLSFMGLPCPNIFTGGHNFHGKYEYIPISSMIKAVEVVVKIAELNHP